MQPQTPNQVEHARMKKHTSLSPFWLLPILALLIAAWLLWTNYQQRGTTITIDFRTADGIVPGRTPIRYQGVEVGTVEGVNLQDNYQKIQIKASIKQDMADALREETQFWLVTPQASLAGVSGLDALVGGNYIGMMPGRGKPRTQFVAQDGQPNYRVNTGELLIHLTAPDLGSLNIGSQVYYRKIPVGKVYDYAINSSSNGVIINVLIERRFANLVKKTSRFWNVSGLDANVSLSGASLKVESLSSLVNGAIAFDSPNHAPAADRDANFKLYVDLAHSQRGKVIQLDLPDGSNLRVNQTALIYKGLEVGTLTKLDVSSSGKVSGELTIDPSVADLMRSNTRIEMRSPKISLKDAELSRLLTGNTFELIPGEGAAQYRFTVLPASQALRQQPNTTLVRLTAPESYGIDVGQPLIARGIAIGQILERKLAANGVNFTLAITPEYRHLLHGNSKFIVNSRLDIKLNSSGMQVLAASPHEWLEGGIKLIPGTDGAARTHYPLFADVELAEQGIIGARPSATLYLSATVLPDVQAGSAVLYRKFQVGEIIDVVPQADGFNIAVYIMPKYRNLLTNNSVFWSEGGARLQLNSNGLTVDALPLNRALKGAISFDNLPGVQRIPGTKPQLYASQLLARNPTGQITLITPDASKLSVGTPLRYRGIEVGQITDLKLTLARNQVAASATLYTQYAADIAKIDSRFSIIAPDISAAGVDHLESLVQTYIDVVPGKGRSHQQFQLQDRPSENARYADGLTLYVDAIEAGSVTIGTPVLFRGLEVGVVTDSTLGYLADRVQLTLKVAKKYQHLVRENSLFWLASGYNIDFGLLSGVATTGTLQQFIRGGIQFATPPSTRLAPQATRGKHYLLLDEAPDNWRKWGTALPTTSSR